MILFFDTETTGKAHYRAGYKAPFQPHIVELTAVLMDDDANAVMSMSVIIRPDGWTIPDEATDVHGISQSFAEQVGVPIKTALNIFSRIRRSADVYCAHNIEFDRLMLFIEFFRVFGDGFEMPEEKCFCTMKAMMDECRLSGGYNGEYKWPKLIEAYRHAFGHDFDDQHSALADVNACSSIYFWLKGKAFVSLEPAKEERAVA